MSEPKKSESIFNLQIGPAFFAIILSIAASFAQFMYTQGQQSAAVENTGKAIDKLEKVAEKQKTDQDNITGRLVKVETIVSIVQQSLSSIDDKIDRIAESFKVDKR
jgi:predicted lipoprotein